MYKYKHKDLILSRIRREIPRRKSIMDYSINNG